MIVAKKRTWFVAATFFLCFLQMPLGAASFALSISQLDASTSAVNPVSSLFESLVMDAFFERGFIVSNFPIEASRTAEKTDFSGVLTDAVEGSIDYVVTIIIFYEMPPKTTAPGKGTSQIKYADWKLYNVRDWNLEASGRLDDASGFISGDEKVLTNYAKKLGKSIADAL